MTLKNNRSSLLCHIKLWASFQSHRWIQTGVTARKRSIWEKISDFFFVPCDLEIWWMTLKNNRAPLLCCFKLCASFHSHRWIETSYSPEHPQFGPKSAIFVLCDLEIWRMTLKTIGLLFYATSSFVHHFVAIGELELQPETPNLGQNRRFVEPRDFEIWRMTLKNNRPTSILCIISSSYVNSNWSYSPETAKLGYDLCDLDLWLMTLTFCMGITSVIGNNSWNFRDDTIAEK